MYGIVIDRMGLGGCLLCRSRSRNRLLCWRFKPDFLRSEETSGIRLALNLLHLGVNFFLFISRGKQACLL